MAGADSVTGKYEFLDHTADVQIHAWGDDMRETFENAAVAMTAYITDIDSIDITQKESILVEADDIEGLLYRFLDEVLFLFNAEPYLLSRRVEIVEFCEFRIRAKCHGEPFSLDKHEQGTEIKAITYSAMRIVQQSDKCEVYFIVDI